MTVAAQEKSPSRLDSIVYYGSRGKLYTMVYEYQENQIIQKKLGSGYAGSYINIPDREEAVIFRYDDNGTLLEEDAGPIICYFGSCTGGRKVYSYNDDGTLWSIVCLSKDRDSQKWKLTSRYSDYSIPFDSWQEFLGGGIMFSYNDQKELIEEKIVSWDKDSYTWIEVGTVEHFYDTGNCIESSCYTADYESDWRKIRDFDKYGNCTREITSKSYSRLELAHREFHYDESGTYLKKTIEYNPEGQAVYENIYSYFENGDLKERTEYDLNSLMPVNFDLYYYSKPVSASIQNHLSQKIGIFPNPFRHLLNIKTGSEQSCEARIIDLKGKLILSFESLGPTHQLDLSSFEPGVYFITIRSKDFVETRKIMKL
jgi:hypothetical protein